MSNGDNWTGDRHEIKEKELGERQERVELYKARVELFKTLATFGAFAALLLSIGGPLILLFAPSLKECAIVPCVVASGIGGFLVIAAVVVAYRRMAKDTRLCSPPPETTLRP